MRITDLAREIVRLSGKEIEIAFVQAETMIWGQVLDCTKARVELDWVPKVGLQDGLQRTYAWVRATLADAPSATQPDARRAGA